MRTIEEILEAAKSGGEWPTHEECFWTMQALEQGWLMTQRKYHEQVFSPKSEPLAKQLAENDFEMGKRCMLADPRTWLGPDRDYSKPENRKRREVALGLYRKAARGELQNQKSN